MAPEVIRHNQGSETTEWEKADIWSLGCAVIEMATAKAPWDNAFSNPFAAMYKIGYTDMVPSIPDRLSHEGREFLLKCFQRNPLTRPTVSVLRTMPFITSVSLFLFFFSYSSSPCCCYVLHFFLFQKLYCIHFFRTCILQSAFCCCCCCCCCCYYTWIFAPPPLFLPSFLIIY